MLRHIDPKAQIERGISLIALSKKKHGQQKSSKREVSDEKVLSDVLSPIFYSRVFGCKMILGVNPREKRMRVFHL